MSLHTLPRNNRSIIVTVLIALALFLGVFTIVRHRRSR